MILLAVFTAKQVPNASPWKTAEEAQNSIDHNERSCKIYVSISAQNGQCTITVADDGIGATDEQIEKLGKAPRYMICDEHVAEQRHGRVEQVIFRGKLYYTNTKKSANIYL